MSLATAAKFARRELRGGLRGFRIFLACLALGVAAIAGHNWTIFLSFKGGKGVATTLGVLLTLFAVPTLIALAVAIFIILTTRFVSLGSMIGAIVFPILFSYFYRGVENYSTLLVLLSVLAFLIVFKHRKNIERLRKGEENKLF